MAKINRITGNVDAFAKDALGTERTVFGGVTQSDDLNDQINDEFKRGWGIVGPSEFPKIQDFNAVGFTMSMMSAYLYQMGIAEWHGAQQYQIRSVVNAPDGIYICKTANHTSATSPKDDPSNWDALVAQSFGTDTSVTVSQKVITDELNARLPRAAVVGVTGTSATEVMSQKIVTDELSNKVGLSGNQAIGGIKTFSSFPVTPSAAPTANYQAANKKYVDDSAIGVGQTWQVVTEDRSIGTIYTNTTGRTIYVSVVIYETGTTNWDLEIDGVKIGEVGAWESGSGTFSGVVPNGSTYRVYRSTGSGGTIRNWAELR